MIQLDSTIHSFPQSTVKIQERFQERVNDECNWGSLDLQLDFPFRESKEKTRKTIEKKSEKMDQ